MTVDVIIPTYKPDRRLLYSLDMLRKQTMLPRRIVIINTEQRYLDDFVKEAGINDLGQDVEVRNIPLSLFDHGATRNEGTQNSNADLLLLMTQDAVAFDDKMIENMVSAFTDEQVASCYARQLPLDDATLAEQYSRKFNYGENSFVKSKDDLPRLGIKTYFCSNACAMYRRAVFEKLGKFPTGMIFNEDMVYAHKVISNDYKIAYVAEAKVLHSHNYTNMQQFHRNFDLAVSQAMHPEVFEGISSESEGSSYAKTALKYFIECKRPLYFVPFAFTCAFRLAGYKLGKNYEKLSHEMILKCTMSPKFFERYWSEL